MLANHAVYTFSPLSTMAPASPSPLAGQGLRHKLKRRTSVVFDVKMMEDHVYVVVDDEVCFRGENMRELFVAAVFVGYGAFCGMAGLNSKFSLVIVVRFYQLIFIVHTSDCKDPMQHNLTLCLQ